MAKNAEKETALYEAVFRLLARGEKMYSVTVQQIAEEAGIGKGTVYEYFTSREEIISKAMGLPPSRGGGRALRAGRQSGRL